MLNWIYRSSFCSLDKNYQCQKCFCFWITQSQFIYFLALYCFVGNVKYETWDYYIITLVMASSVAMWSCRVPSSNPTLTCGCIWLRRSLIRTHFVLKGRLVCLQQHLVCVPSSEIFSKIPIERLVRFFYYLRCISRYHLNYFDLNVLLRHGILQCMKFRYLFYRQKTKIGTLLGHTYPYSSCDVLPPPPGKWPFCFSHMLLHVIILAPVSFVLLKTILASSGYKSGINCVRILLAFEYCKADLEGC